MQEIISSRIANRTRFAPTWKEGLEATILAIKANETVTKSRIELTDDLFAI